MLIRGRVVKANASGTGFFRCLSGVQPFKVGQSVTINFLGTTFFSRITNYDGLGFYIPRKFMLEHNILNRIISATLKKNSMFCVKVGCDGRATIPYGLLDKYSLHEGDVVRLKIISPIKIKVYTRVFKIERTHRPTEHTFIVRNKRLRDQTLVLDIDTKLPRFFSKRKHNPRFLDITTIFKTKPLFRFDKNHVLIHFRNNYLVAPQRLEISNRLALYLGAFFADGTKKGNYWRINASTPKQAMFYIKMHKCLCAPKNLKCALTVTNHSILTEDKRKEELNLFWSTNANVNLRAVYLLEPKGQYNQKINDNGSLGICDYRQDVLSFYNTLLNSLISLILNSTNSGLARSFFLGLLEGDGNAGAIRGVVLTTNSNDSVIIEKILNKSNLVFSKYKEKENKVYFRIGALELIKNVQLLYKMFMFYPKRRNKLIKRMLNVGVVKHFFDPGRKTPAWIKLWLKKEGFVNSKHELTKKGKTIKDILINLKKEIV